MDDQRIEKKTCSVVFEFSDGGKVTGEVFLGLHESHHLGRQKLGDLLNVEELFVPVSTPKGFILLNTAQILSAKIGAESEKDELMTLGKKHSVRIRMSRGGEVVGDVYANLPDESSRVKDLFNQSSRFLPVFLPDSIVYINRHFILSVQD